MTKVQLHTVQAALNAIYRRYESADAELKFVAVLIPLSLTGFVGPGADEKDLTRPLNAGQSGSGSRPRYLH